MFKSLRVVLCETELKWFDGAINLGFVCTICGKVTTNANKGRHLFKHTAGVTCKCGVKCKS